MPKHSRLLLITPATNRPWPIAKFKTNKSVSTLSLCFFSYCRDRSSHRSNWSLQQYSENVDDHPEFRYQTRQHVCQHLDVPFSIVLALVNFLLFECDSTNFDVTFVFSHYLLRLRKKKRTQHFCKSLSNFLTVGIQNLSNNLSMMINCTY